jgi:hypothetical protein
MRNGLASAKPCRVAEARDVIDERSTVYPVVSLSKNTSADTW